MEARARVHAWWATVRALWRGFVAFWQEGGDLKLPSRRSWAWEDSDYLLDQAAERLGLDRADAEEVKILRGYRGDLEVAVQVRRIPWKNQETRFEQLVTVRAPTPLAAASVRIQPRPPRRPKPGSAPPERRPTPPPSVRTRDRTFDEAMTVSGSEEVSLALLSTKLRAIVLGHGGQWTLEEGRLEWKALRAPNFLTPSTEKVIEFVEEALERGPDVVDGLAHRVRHDQNSSVRRRALALLWERHEADPRTRKTTVAATQDWLPLLRLDAALALGAEGHPTLVELAESPTTPRGLRRTAASHLPPADADLESRFCLLLEDEDVTQQVVAAEILGQLGGPHSLRRLEPLTGRFAAPAPLRQAAREAVSRITARHAHLDAGHLSFAEPTDPAGALSPAVEEGPDGG